MSESQRETVLPEMNIKGTIIKTSPTIVEELLLDKLAKQITEIYNAEDMDKSLEEMTKTVSKFIDNVLRPYLSTRLGGQIVDPKFGVEIVRDRIVQFAEMVMSLQIEYTDKIISEIESNILTKEKVREKIRRLLYIIDISSIIIREIANRLFTLLQINAPAQARPPLVNALIGLDIIGGEE